MATTTNALSNSLMKPSASINGAVTEAAVTNATVEEPWALFNAAANRKGSRIPRLDDVRSSPNVAATPEFWRTVPKIPPAPVTMIIVAESVRASLTQPSAESICLSNFLGRNKHRAKPTSRAMTGSPKKSRKPPKYTSHPSAAKYIANDLLTINKMGTIIGSDELSKLGRWASVMPICSSISPGSTNTFAATLWAKSKPAPSATPDAIKPKPITSPKLAPRIPAAAIGPGVGGTNAWVQDRPNPSATAVPANERPALLV